MKTTNETSHTPGPWIAIESKTDDGYYYIQKSINADKVYPEWGIAMILNYQNCDKANAQLIAAAPEMLAAMERLLGSFESDKELAPMMDVLTCWETNSQSIAQAREVIRKAKGQA